MTPKESQAARRARTAHIAAALIAAGFLAACGRQGSAAKQPPVAIQADDTSATCGMYITHYPGPRGEAYVIGATKPLKFGSTRDFFSYVTQPDVVHRLQALYVQDTAHIGWAHPSNAASSFIDARKALYVAWQPLTGDMGPTFASFGHRSDAQAFIRFHGGALLTFSQITPGLVSGLTGACPSIGSPFYEMAAKAECTAGRLTSQQPGMALSK